MAARIFVVDDEPGICRALERFLLQRGDSCLAFARAEEALAAAAGAGGPPDLVILDVRLPGMSGIEALPRFRALSPAPAVVVITAHGTLDVAVDAVRLGAFDYLAKPVDLARVGDVVERALAGRAAAVAADPGADPASLLVGRSGAMQEVFKKIGALALSDVPVLVTGESGTGKEMVARAIHRASRRSAGPFEPVDCASLPETLFESELFGHERGAFTGAIARRVGRLERSEGGTLFLDEVGEIPPASQAKLLRFLETRTFERLGGSGPASVDARVVAATHRDLAERIRLGLFREDLFYRLDVISIRIPPLRERPEDIPLLVAHFLAQDRGGPAGGISREALDRLTAHPWPGNVRELRNAVEHARVLARGSPILPGNLPPGIGGAAAPAGEEDALIRAVVRRLVAEAGDGAGDLHGRLSARFEKPLFEEVLARTGGNQVRAARILGIHRTTLRERMERYGIV